MCMTQKSLFSFQVISRRKDMRKRNRDYLVHIWPAPIAMFNRGNQVKLFDSFMIMLIDFFPTQNVSIIEHLPIHDSTNNALMPLIIILCSVRVHNKRKNQRLFGFFLCCSMLICVGDYIIIFWCVQQRSLLLFFCTDCYYNMTIIRVTHEHKTVRYFTDRKSEAF
jgi:hypothetical protein